MENYQLGKDMSELRNDILSRLGEQDHALNLLLEAAGLLKKKKGE